MIFKFDFLDKNQGFIYMIYHDDDNVLGPLEVAGIIKGAHILQVKK